MLMCKSYRLNLLRTLGPCLFLSLLCGLGISSARAVRANSSSTPLFRGATALADTKHAVSFGERSSGSETIVQLREWISLQLTRTGGELSRDAFQALTPAGPIPMVNIILKFPGSSGRAIVLTGHYDTKKIPMVHFVGANDAGSSTGFLIELAHTLSLMKCRDDIYLVFFDGEEAVGTWTDQDSLYGSRHLSSKWAAEGLLSRIRALINVDMIGDKDLDILNDGNSSQGLRDQVWRIAAKLGYGKYFRNDVSGVDDDHKPFVDAGVNAIDIIDLDYGPAGKYWHTTEDTMDKLSERSFQVVGDVMVELIRELEQQ